MQEAADEWFTHRMGRALVAVGVLLALCFGVMGYVIFATREEDRVAVDQVTAEELSRALTLAEELDAPVIVDAVTKFTWDEMLLVQRRTPRSVLDAELGFEFKGDLPYDAESGDTFVFLLDGRLKRFADYRGRGRFEGVDRPIARFTPETAVFEVRDLVARPAAP